MIGKITPNAASTDTGVRVAGKMMPEISEKNDVSSEVTAVIASVSAVGIVRASFAHRARVRHVGPWPHWSRGPESHRRYRETSPVCSYRTPPTDYELTRSNGGC